MILFSTTWLKFEENKRRRKLRILYSHQETAVDPEISAIHRNFGDLENFRVYYAM